MGGPTAGRLGSFGGDAVPDGDAVYGDQQCWQHGNFVDGQCGSFERAGNRGVLSGRDEGVGVAGE